MPEQWIMNDIKGLRPDELVRYLEGGARRYQVSEEAFVIQVAAVTGGSAAIYGEYGNKVRQLEAKATRSSTNLIQPLDTTTFMSLIVKPCRAMISDDRGNQIVVACQSTTAAGALRWIGFVMPTSVFEPGVLTDYIPIRKPNPHVARANRKQIALGDAQDYISKAARHMGKPAAPRPDTT